MSRRIFFTLIVLSMVVDLHAQGQAAKPAVDVDKLAVNWVDQFNGLSKWYLSLDGKDDGASEAVDRMMNLLAPDVIAQVPPHDEEQIGPVRLVGKDQVRQWVEKIAKTQVQINYKIQRQTEAESDGELMVHAKPLPWGGTSVAFQVMASHTSRETRIRYLELGAVFLQYGEDGKIHRIRLLLSEKDEVLDNQDDEL
jgi:hypothetical protein